MSDFDRENEDVFQIVHDNPRRRGVTRNVGYIINTEQAQRFAVYEAEKKRGGMRIRDIALMCIAVMTIICIPVVELICEIIK